MSFVELPVNDEVLQNINKIFNVKYTDDDLEGYKTLAKGKWFGIKTDDKIVAQCFVEPLGKNKGIVNFGVLPEERQKGYAKMLMRKVLDTYPTKNFSLNVLHGNHKAFRLYRSFGFVFDDDYVSKNNDDSLMVLNRQIDKWHQNEFFTPL